MGLSVTTPRASDHHGAGCQPTGSAKPLPPPRVQSHAHAAETLDDTRYLVYVFIQAAKLFISLAAKRWPDAR